MASSRYGSGMIADSIIDELIDITKWKNRPKHKGIKRGTCDKQVVADPKDGMLCIFKLPKDDRKHQIWSEMLASFIAGQLGWDAQRAGVAIKKDPSSGKIIQVGNLLPYIMKSTENGGSEVLNNGELVCVKANSNYRAYDRKFRSRGSGNTLPLLQNAVCDQIHRQYGIEKRQFLDFLSRMFAFDTLITCTDRHPENWGFITDKNDPGKNRMAPFFDNASSLGCSELNAKIKSAFDKNGSMIKKRKDGLKGKFRHHVRLDKPARYGATFMNVSRAFLNGYPEGRAAFEEATRLDIDEVDALMTSIRKRFKLPKQYTLTKTRQKHIRVMLEIGKERIERILNESS